MTRATSRAVRLNNLRKRLEERPLTVVELAELEGVGRRSVERDLNALREMGEDLEPDASNRYFIEPPPSSLNNVEALALYTAARTLQHTRIGGSHYRSAMAKLTNQLPGPASSMLRRSDERPRTPRASERSSSSPRRGSSSECCDAATCL